MLRKILDLLVQTKQSEKILENKEMKDQLSSDQMKLLVEAVTKNELLPILELAHAFEHNGDPKEHAKKLDTLFGDRSKALEYLIAFGKKYPGNEQFVHDACLFSPPTKSLTWKKLATQNGAKLLLDPELKHILFLTKEVEAQLELDKNDITNLTEALKIKYEKKDLAELETLLKSKIAELNKFCKKYETQADERKEDDKTKYIKALEERNQLYADCACLHLTVPFKQWTLNHLRDYYTRYRLLLGKDTKAFFFKHGLSEDNYKTFIELDRSIAGQNIPDVKVLPVNGQFYLRKLNVQNEEDAALAAVLGKLTDCCQSLSGETGEPCAIHGLTSADSGFYVLFEGDSEHPSSNDKVWGQTWVCRTEAGSLLFDSIESMQGKVSSKNAEIVTTAYRQLATVLTQKHGISRVQCGARSGVSKAVGIKSTYRFTAEPPKNYSAYRDSYKQLLLSDQQLLFSFISKDSKEMTIDQTALNQEISLLNTTGVLSEKLLFNIGFIIQNNLSWLTPLMAAMPSQYTKEQIEHYANLQKEFLSLQSQYSNGEKVEEKLFALIKSNPIDFNIWQNDPLLLQVVEKNNIDGLQLILQHKAMVNIQNKSGSTALMLAAEKGHQAGCSLLLSAKADVNINNTDNETAIKLLAYGAGDITIANQLIEAKADVNSQTKYRRTALMYASQKGHTELVERLIAAKAVVNIPNREDKDDTALIWAIQNGHNEIIMQLLTAKADVNIRGFCDNTALIVAATTGNTKIIKQLLEEKANIHLKDDRNNTPLMKAAENGHAEIVDLLLEEKSEINITAMFTGDTDLLLATKGNHFDVVKKLIAAKANINYQNIDQRNTPEHTALAIAAENGQQEIVEELLAAKANVNLKGHYTSPLAKAIEKGHSEIAKQIIDAKADVNADFLSHIPLVHAVEQNNKELVALLLTKKADVNVEQGAPLVCAASCGHLELVSLLLEMKAHVEVSERDPFWGTALSAAVSNNQEKVVIKLIEEKANIDFVGHLEYTPLMKVAESGNTKMLELLINAKANLSMQNCFKDTALNIATTKKHTDCIKLLEAAQEKERPTVKSSIVIPSSFFSDKNSASSITTSIPEKAEFHSKKALAEEVNNGWKAIREKTNNIKKQINDYKSGPCLWGGSLLLPVMKEGQISFIGHEKEYNETPEGVLIIKQIKEQEESINKNMASLEKDIESVEKKQTLLNSWQDDLPSKEKGTDNDSSSTRGLCR